MLLSYLSALYSTNRKRCCLKLYRYPQVVALNNNSYNSYCYQRLSCNNHFDYKQLLVALVHLMSRKPGWCPRSRDLTRNDSRSQGNYNKSSRHTRLIFVFWCLTPLADAGCMNTQMDSRLR